MQQVTVRVPASTSNLGPGFDCLGLALRIYNEVTLHRGRTGPISPMAREIADRFFAVTRRERFDFSCTIRGNVPVGRGLGSSATIRVGLVHALNELARAKLTREQLFDLAADLEKHPDNAAPASFGGFTVARPSRVQRLLVSPRLLFVLLIPDFEIATSKARGLFPDQIRRVDAIESAQNAAAITGAFAKRDYLQLRGCFRDGLHQPYRKKLVPFLDQTIAAAENAGAVGAFLSGSGPAICALTLDRAQEIGNAMLLASKLERARIIITRPDNRGARIVKSKIQNPKSKIA